MPKMNRKIYIFIAVIFLIIAVVAWYVIAHKNNASTKTVKAVTTAASLPLHTSDEAVQSAEMIYKDYLPLKTQVDSAVGNNPNVEPAEVQVMRASEQSFTKELYDSVLSTYMDEYQSTGKVTKDLVVCNAVSPTTSTVALASKTENSATVNVTLTLKNGTTKTIPVTIDLHSLKAEKIDCSM